MATYVDYKAGLSIFIALILLTVLCTNCPWGQISGPGLGLLASGEAVTKLKLTEPTACSQYKMWPTLYCVDRNDTVHMVNIIIIQPRLGHLAPSTTLSIA